MSWASRRRAAYGTGVFLFLVCVIGGPALYWYITIPPSCTDGIMNQGETAPDRGGPCLLLDSGVLAHAPALWSRSFRVRDGVYNTVTYIQNTNENAGVRSVAYRLALYDSQNVLIAERKGRTFIVPGSITPIFEPEIETGSRDVVRTYFEYDEKLQWERMTDRAKELSLNDITLNTPDTTPSISAMLTSNAVENLNRVYFIVTVFDQAGNAMAASRTFLEVIEPRERREIVFTWPSPFPRTVGRIDIIPLLEPELVRSL